MTTDPTAETIPETTKQPPSTAGMTTKVVVGSIWTLAGQVVPLFATLVSTPITIRLLGSEGYGVLLLVGLIPNYFAFADLGMSVASTRFGSKAYSEGDPEYEGAVVRTAALVAVLSTSVVAIPIVIFSPYFVEILGAPAALRVEAAAALRVTAIAWVVSVLSSVFNTPQLSRLRMDLNSIIGGGGRVLLAASVPIVLYLGGGILGASLVGLGVAGLTLCAHILASGSLLKQLYRLSVDGAVAKTLIRFGIGLFLTSVATVVIINFEKILLPSLHSVEALAYYSVAFTLASMISMYGAAVVQSLIPAFSQLTSGEKKDEFNILFSRSARFNIIWLPPVSIFLYVIAEPFLTLWAGPDFGLASTIPFRVLLVGLLFTIVAYVPYSAIVAAGRSDILAKLCWIELITFAGIAYFLVSSFGILGAALSWSLRVVIDAFFVIYLAKRFANVELDFVGQIPFVILGLGILSPAVMVNAFAGGSLIAAIFTFAVCASLYSFAAWRFFLQPDERIWMKTKASRLWRARRTSPVH